ncbi:MAG: rhodanese-like domain-containing protein [Bdellovibrionota bacterium]
MEKAFHITAVYYFQAVAQEEIERRKQVLDCFGENPLFCGLILLAPEGFNGTVAGPAEDIKRFKETLIELAGSDQVVFKDSFSNFKPYKRYKVKIKDEIVTFDEQIKPKGAGQNTSHLSPAEWHKMIEEEDVVLVDTRNKYETAVGMFKGAIDPKIDKFTEFKTYVETANLPKDKPVLMYCTGGIRCEKAVLDMQLRGYENVFQLEGGILKYLEEYPDGYWDGECFVFDHRVAVDRDLKPSEKYKLCPHCGDPGGVHLDCSHCSNKAVVCSGCLEKAEYNRTCSKNCKHHYKRSLGVLDAA